MSDAQSCTDKLVTCQLDSVALSGLFISTGQCCAE